MIYFVVALPCEANPLLRHFRMSLVTKRPFPIYRRSEIALVISGVGKIAAAAATAYLYAYMGNFSGRWLNVGIGGHRLLPLGKGVFASKIKDEASGAKWLLPQNNLWETEKIISVDRPQTDYTQICIYEMEAAGFYSTAIRFASRQQIQCFKIVSDNCTSSIAQITKNQIQAWVSGNMNTIDKFLEAGKQPQETRD